MQIKEASPDCYKACLLTLYAGKVNLACTCKLARFEDNGIKHYTFNQAKQNMQSWIDNCKNPAQFKELFDTLQKCKCS